jgi:hypothetical protein
VRCLTAVSLQPRLLIIFQLGKYFDKIPLSEALDVRKNVNAARKKGGQCATLLKVRADPPFPQVHLALLVASLRLLDMSIPALVLHIVHFLISCSYWD